MLNPIVDTNNPSDESGLLLLLMDVIKDSPAWLCGLRDGDAIVTINEWQITLMDKPEVKDFVSRE